MRAWGNYHRTLMSSYSQESLPGMEHLSPKQFAPRPNPRLEGAVLDPSHGDPALAARLQRRQANRSVNETRYASETDESPGARIKTAEFGVVRPERGRQIPHWASFHGSAAGARKVSGSVQEVPMVMGNKTGPQVYSPQTRVTKARFEEARTKPETRQSPRFFGRGLEDLPHVFRHENGNVGIIDGNHRVTSSIANGQMIHQVRVFTHENEQKVKGETKRITDAEGEAATKAERRWAKSKDVIYPEGHRLHS